MPMGVVMLIIFAALVLDPSLEKRVESTLQGVSGSLVKGTVGTTFNYWILGAGIAAAFGFGIWILETKVAKSQGQELPAPPVSSIPVPQVPSFGSSTGLNAGPIQTGSSFSSGGGSTSGGSAGVGRPIRKKATKSSAFGS